MVGHTRVAEGRWRGVIEASQKLTFTMRQRPLSLREKLAASEGEEIMSGL